MTDVYSNFNTKDVRENSPTPSLEKLLKAVHGEKDKDTEGPNKVYNNVQIQAGEAIGIDMEEIEVIDGMALLEEKEGKEDSQIEFSEVFLESGVEVGRALPPSKHKIKTMPPVS